MSKSKGPQMTDCNIWMAAGIDPKTQLPVRSGNPEKLKNSMLRLFSIMDEQDAITRYTWYNLPGGLTSQELERLLYFKGQLVLFYHNDQYWFMPYALSGGLDFYGRYKKVHPVPISNTDGKENKAQAAYLANINLEIVYDIPDDPEKILDIIENPENYGFLLCDYSKEISQVTEPRVNLQMGLINLMSSIIPFSRTALLNSTGTRGMRVSNQDDYPEVEKANKKLLKAAEQGEPMVPIIANLDFQELTSGNVGNIQDFLIALQSYDNLRLSAYGLDTGGLFDKKAYVNRDQNELNKKGRSTSPLTDGLLIRQHLCDLFNAFTDWGTWVELSEEAAGGDLDGDGILGETDVNETSGEEDQSLEE